MPSINKYLYKQLQQQCNCPDCTIANGSKSKSYFSVVPILMANLPEVKARPGFERKMAAAFAIELEEEVDRRNRSWLRKSQKISLPEVIKDLSQEFL